MTEFKHILVPFDNSKKGLKSMKTASKLAGDMGGKVTIFQCVEKKVPRYFFFKTKQDKLDDAINVNFAESKAKKFLDIAKKYGANVTTKIKKVEDNSHDHVIDFVNSNDVDLVVMSPSKKINTREIHESVVDKVARNINCSLLRVQ